ncbi:hypothetical protein K466DRAFT_91513 [Polyporus arcularius HHB13444]|uniref:Uncharacterized protein n=1 Tax=Polyporus arcularius HHB13444 TaxID=1314778 RepID=A0A5C3PUS6_9APHY|nr:hypothetical protein K466DRAFT_91513 [Polyporus arcularius HHB13444]
MRTISNPTSAEPALKASSARPSCNRPVAMPSPRRSRVSQDRTACSQTWFCRTRGPLQLDSTTDTILDMMHVAQYRAYQALRCLHLVFSHVKIATHMRIACCTPPACSSAPLPIANGEDDEDVPVVCAHQTVCVLPDDLGCFKLAFMTSSVLAATFCTMLNIVFGWPFIRALTPSTLSDEAWRHLSATATPSLLLCLLSCADTTFTFAYEVLWQDIRPGQSDIVAEEQRRASFKYLASTSVPTTSALILPEQL